MIYGSGAYGAGTYGVTFPSADLPVRYELFYDGDWHDISVYVYTRDTVTIKHGYSSTIDKRMEPSSATITLNNRDGRFSPRNPTSPLYGKIGRNTQMRISAPYAGTYYTRIVGEIPAWPARWDLSGKDVWVPIEVAGVTRRLGQGSSPLLSTLHREQRLDTSVTAYWPMEELSGSTFTNEVPGGSTMGTTSGAVVTAGYDGFACSLAIPQVKNGRLVGTVGSVTGAGSGGPVVYYPPGFLQVKFLAHIPSGTTDGSTIISLLVMASNAVRWDLIYGAGGALTLKAYDSAGTLALDSGAFSFGLDDKNVRISVDLKKNGITTDWQVTMIEAGGFVGSIINGNIAGITNKVNSVIINDKKTLGDTAIGHVAVGNAIRSVFDMSWPLAAYDGENSFDRFLRVCAENAIPAQAAGTYADTPLMGPQPISDLLAILGEIGQLSGSLCDARSNLGLYLTPLGWTINHEDTAIALDYSAPGHISADFLPTEDDDGLRNVVTVSRPGGSGATVEDATSILGTQAPPLGVGTYDDSVTLNLHDDATCYDWAGWRLHLGTWPEARYPSLTVNIATLPAAIAPQIIQAWLSSVISIANLPAWLAPGGALLSVCGYTEVIGPYDWKITFVCAPAGALALGELDQGRLDESDSVLAADITSSATTLTASWGTVRWVVTASEPAEFPYDIFIGGERMTVTAATGTGSPQSFTVTRSVNGVIKSHVAGEQITVAVPLYLSPV